MTTYTKKRSEGVWVGAKFERFGFSAVPKYRLNTAERCYCGEVAMIERGVDDHWGIAKVSVLTLPVESLGRSQSEMEGALSIAMDALQSGGIRALIKFATFGDGVDMEVGNQGGARPLVNVDGDTISVSHPNPDFGPINQRVKITERFSFYALSPDRCERCGSLDRVEEHTHCVDCSCEDCGEGLQLWEQDRCPDCADLACPECGDLMHTLSAGQCEDCASQEDEDV